MPNITESTLTIRDGTRLFIRDWLADASTENQNQPCIVMLHGLGEHGGRYEHIATFFNSRGFSVRTYDHRGHGQSDGVRGDCPDDLRIVDDAEIIIRDFAQHCQTDPILFGHSMGGLIAARITLAARLPIRGLILSSPALDLRLTWPHRLLRLLLKVVAPHFPVSLPFNPAYLSHQLATVVAYINDPLVHHQITASMLSSLLSAIDFVQTNAPRLTVPTLLLVAEDDLIVGPQGSHTFYKALPDTICTAHFYAGFYHEIFNETDASTVFDDLENWLTAQHVSHQ